WPAPFKRRTRSDDKSCFLNDLCGSALVAPLHQTYHGYFFPENVSRRIAQPSASPQQSGNQRDLLKAVYRAASIKALLQGGRSGRMFRIRQFIPVL
ncbi:hypothetical protein, partial [Akkermansia massiliensis]